MQISQIPNKLPIPFANSGTKNAIPQASQVSVTPGAASLTDGFPPLTMTALAAGGVPPFGADFNGIFNWLSQISQWANAGGMYLYDSAFSTTIGGYPKGATILKADGSGIWMSTTDNNTTNPDTGGAGWATIALQNPVPLKTFAQIAALSADQGPIRCSDMGDSLYTWTTSAYFTGYRNVLCGEIPKNTAPTPRAWELATIGGTWSTSDPKQNRVIALYQERGYTVAAASWIPGMDAIVNLGSGNWKAPDHRNTFWRVAGTDADTANPAPAGMYQGWELPQHQHTTPPGSTGYLTLTTPTGTVQIATTGNAVSVNIPATGNVAGAAAGAELRTSSTRVSSVILV